MQIVHAQRFAMIVFFSFIVLNQSHAASVSGSNSCQNIFAARTSSHFFSTFYDTGNLPSSGVDYHGEDGELHGGLTPPISAKSAETKLKKAALELVGLPVDRLHSQRALHLDLSDFDRLESELPKTEAADVSFFANYSAFFKKLFRLGRNKNTETITHLVRVSKDEAHLVLETSFGRTLVFTKQESTDGYTLAGLLFTGVSSAASRAGVLALSNSLLVTAEVQVRIPDNSTGGILELPQTDNSYWVVRNLQDVEEPVFKLPLKRGERPVSVIAYRDQQKIALISNLSIVIVDTAANRMTRVTQLQQIVTGKPVSHSSSPNDKLGQGLQPSVRSAVLLNDQKTFAITHTVRHSSNEWETWLSFLSPSDGLENSGVMLSNGIGSHHVAWHPSQGHSLQDFVEIFWYQAGSLQLPHFEQVPSLHQNLKSNLEIRPIFNEQGRLIPEDRNPWQPVAH